jgi:hypothetical protein
LQHQLNTYIDRELDVQVDQEIEKEGGGVGGRERVAINPILGPMIL